MKAYGIMMACSTGRVPGRCGKMPPDSGMQVEIAPITDYSCVALVRVIACHLSASLRATMW